MWKHIGLGAGFLLVIALPAALHAVSAAPERAVVKAAPAAKTASADTFVATCSATEAVDTRPDPAWVGASFAHDDCWAPTLPARVNGYTASLEQVNASIAAAKRYNAQADIYQQCISHFVAARRAQAGQEKKPLELALLTIETHRITASEDNKKKVAALTVNTINAFNELGSECK